MDVFQKAILSQLQELKAADLFQDPGAGKVTEIMGRLAKAETAMAVAKEKFEKDPDERHVVGADGQVRQESAGD